MDKPSQIAVTGASGFVGTWLMRHFCAIGVDAVPFFEPNGPALNDPDFIRARMRALKPHAVVHLAAVAAPADARRSPAAAFETNVLGTLNIAEAILEYSKETRFVFAGSSESYGRSFNLSTEPLSEDAALEPQTVYGVTKASADMLLGQMAGEGLDVVRLRPFNHTGPGQTEAYVVPAFARQIAMIEAGRQEPTIDVGDLDAERDFLDVRDIVRAYAMAALRREPLSAGCVLNLASGTPRRIASVLDDLLALSDKRIVVRQDPARMRKAGTPRAVGDASRAQALLGWQAGIPFNQTLQDVLESWRERQSGDRL